MIKCNYCRKETSNKKFCSKVCLFAFRRGKTYEQYYGVEKSLIVKRNKRDHFNYDAARVLMIQRNKSKIGKNYIEQYGVCKAELIKTKQCRTAIRRDLNKLGIKAKRCSFLQESFGLYLSMECIDADRLLDLQYFDEVVHDLCNLSGKKYEEFTYSLMYGLEFNHVIRNEVKERDDFRCQLCKKTELEETDALHRKLHCHHINYNKKDCHKDNLIMLCHSCHVKTNYHREYWREYFSNMIILKRNTIADLILR